MKKYWFIVETYVFLWKKEDHIILSVGKDIFINVPRIYYLLWIN